MVAPLLRRPFTQTRQTSVRAGRQYGTVWSVATSRAGRRRGRTSERKSREAWLGVAVEALGEGGVDAVRVEPLARRLGVTKGSFYWHFADRDALLQALLDGWEQQGTEAIIEELERAGGDASQRAYRLWAMTVGDPGLTAELAIRDWARRDETVAARVRRVDDRRIGYLRGLMVELGFPDDEIEARAMLMYSLLIGNEFIAARHGRRSRTRVLEDALRLLLGDGSR